MTGVQACALPISSTRRPDDRRSRLECRPDRTTRLGAVHDPTYRLRGTLGTRQPVVRRPSGRDILPSGRHGSRWVGCPQYPQGQAADRTGRPRHGTGWDRRSPNRADRTKVGLNRRDVHRELIRRAVVHRLLRCPAHTQGGVGLVRPFSTFADLSTAGSTPVDNPNGDDDDGRDGVVAIRRASWRERV